jgi:ribonuclease BN (tRNA processing enzyme)
LPQAARAAFISAAAGVQAGGVAEAAGVRGITLTFFSCAVADVLAAKAARAKAAARVSERMMDMGSAPP